MITDFGAVLSGNTPSPMESFDYFNRLSQQDAILKTRQKQLELEQRKQADEDYEKELKPVRDFKANTGYSDPTPDAVVTKNLKDIEEAAAQMRKQGRSNAQIGTYIRDAMQGVNNLQNWYKNALTSLGEQLKGIDSKSGLDPARVKDLAISEILFVPDGKGGKRLRSASELEDMGNIVPRVLSRHADKLYIENKASIYGMPDSQNSQYAEDLKELKTDDGRVIYGRATVPYNTLYQNVIRTPDKDVKVVTKSVDAERNGEPVIGQDGKPVKVLPEDAYLDFISNPGRMVEVERLTKQKMKESISKNEAQAEEQAKKDIELMYGMKAKSLPYKKRVELVASRKQQILQLQDPVDEELIRQQAAFELADTYIPKKRVGKNEVKDPTKIVVRTGSEKTEKNKEEADYLDAYKEMEEAMTASGGKAVPLSSLEYAVSPVLQYIRKVAGKKPPPMGKLNIFGSDTDYSVDDITISKGSDGKIYANYSGKSLKLPQAIVNKAVNSGRAGVVDAIVEDAKGGKKNPAGKETKVKKPRPYPD